MMVMPSNNTCWVVHYWAGKYGGLGHLLGPDRVERPMPHLPYALDNGAFGAWTNKRPWDAKKFLRHVERYAFGELRPLWVVVPDVVADAISTVQRYQEWAPRLKHDFHLSLAVAVQDGMTPEVVRSLSPAPDLVFVGGSTDWKWNTVRMWCGEFPRVHVGRVNTGRFLRICADAGAESCDGTGWFRGKPQQILDLGHFLRIQAGLPDDGEVESIVRGSRLKGKDQSVLPLLEVA